MPFGFTGHECKTDGCRNPRTSHPGAFNETYYCIECIAKYTDKCRGSIPSGVLREMLDDYWENSVSAAACSARAGGAAFGRPGSQGCSKKQCRYDGRCYMQDPEHQNKYRHDLQDGPVPKPPTSGAASSASGKQRSSMSQCFSCDKVIQSNGELVCSACYWQQTKRLKKK